MFADIAPRVWVATSRLYQTTSTVIVGDDDSCLLIDPAWEADELASIAAWLVERGLRVRAGFATHAHYDHVLWHPGFGDAPRYASRRAAAYAGDNGEYLRRRLADDFPFELRALAALVTGVDELPTEAIPPGVKVELVTHDGHAPGHTAVWLPQQRALLAGDMLSDYEVPLPFNPDDVDLYLAGLDALEPYARRAALVVPGHGSVGNDAMERLAADRHYLAKVVAGREPADARLADPDQRASYERLADIVANRVRAD